MEPNPDPTGERRSQSMIYPWPTPTGGAVLAAIAVAVFMSHHSVAAVGFLIALGGASLLDFAFSAVLVRDRPVTVRPLRAVAEAPARPLTFAVQAPEHDGRITVGLRRISLLDEDADFLVLRPDQSSGEIELPGDDSHGAKHVRFLVSTSWIGLCSARRWVVEMVSMMHRAPGPTGEDAQAPPAAEELTKLRPYVTGDRMGRVAWATTARTGTLHVRTEDPVDDEVTVVVELGPPQLARLGDRMQANHDVTSRAGGIVLDLLAQGRTVRLVTPSIVSKYFDDERDSALAQPLLGGSAKFSVPSHGPVTVGGRPLIEQVSGIVTDRDELIRRLSLVDHHWHPLDVPPGPCIHVSPNGVEERR